MHMADALLSPVVGGVMLVVSGGVIAYSVREVRRNFDERRIPLMGVAGAFVFAAQMVNFSIPGTGSSGHIGGAVLLAALLGPCPAFLVMASVLLVQALFFADGGVLAWGANLFNMGFLGCFLAYPYIFKPLADKTSSRLRLMATSCAACVVSLALGAFAVTVETLLSGVTKLPFAAFAAAMLPIHLAIGLGEGLATGAVLEFVRRQLPDHDNLRLDNPAGSCWHLTWVFGLAAFVIGGGVSLLASGRPDGLEWSMERVSGTAELENSGAIHAVFAEIGEFFAVLPDYTLSGGEGWFGTALSGVSGAIGCALLLVLLGALIVLRRRHVEASSC